MIEMLEAAMTSPWVYLALFAAALLDAFLPVVPSEEMVIIAAVFAAQGGEPNLVVVITVLAIGAIVGDHISYWVGSRTGGRFVRRLRPGSRLRAAFDSAERALSVRGGLLLIIARYIPGGRTVTTLTMGAIRYPLRRFAMFDALAAGTWALYATLIGYLGGAAFANDPLKGLLFGLGLAAGVTVLVEITRRVRRARMKATTASGRRSGGQTGSAPTREGAGRHSPAKTSGDVDKQWVIDVPVRSTS